MEHTESVESMAAERYLLGEMLPEERDAFEEHFFGCAECADDLRAGAAIAAGARGRKAKPQSRPRLAWMSIAAASVFAIVSGYLGGVVVPQLGQQLAAVRQERDAALQPRVLQPLPPLSTAMSRGETGYRIRGDQPVALPVDIAPEQGATGYTLEIVDAGGVTRAKVHVTLDQANDSVRFQPPGSKLPPGRYSLKVSPETAGRPSSVSFEVQ